MLDSNQAAQNIKILQEIEEQKRRIKSQTTTSTSTTLAASASSPLSTHLSLTSTSSTSTNSIQIDIQATSNSIVPQQPKQVNFSVYSGQQVYGTFVNSDSPYGNSILPVLPRF